MVAIIAILAAIAIPNFLAAQTRSKVTRTQAEQKTIATALEAYYVDHNEYAIYNNPLDEGEFHAVPVGITTPVAYITSLPIDVFNPAGGGAHGKPVHPFHYIFEPGSPAEEVALKYESYYELPPGAGLGRKWGIWSHAPDIDCDEGACQYDPTNGTISNGDIARFGP
ncbi:MAG: hypothetical protein QME64_03970 [bacterium]|nr:hypothetical protein [bacterium]